MPANGRSSGSMPRKIASQAVTVIYDKRVASSLLGHLASAINGAAIARGTSFLKSKMGQQIFAKGISVVDDPLRLRGLASRPFDGEGLPMQQERVDCRWHSHGLGA